MRPGSSCATPDVPVEEGEPIEDPISYWLLDRGWDYDYKSLKKPDDTK